MSNHTITTDFGDLDDQSVPEDDLMKILIATDIHLGYELSTKKEHHDSFNTFEEILQLAVENDVDMILLGGDLFHDTKPNATVIQKCLKLLRRYCLGQKDVTLEFLSNPEVVFSHCATKHVNYEDLNINVKIPIFTINGNHDDPTNGIIGSLDVISASGFVNYFGKNTDVNIVRIPPLLFRKGATYMSLQGLSYMNEQRLSRLFRDEKVKFYDIKEKVLGLDNCYNIFVIHQNRVKRGAMNYIPENSFPDFLNLVVWGHEHECMVDPIPVEGKDYYIIQPGSSVATSLCPGEEEPKHVSILYIHKEKYKLRKIKLQTVRPFVMKDIILREEEIHENAPRKFAIYDFVKNYIENEMISEAARKVTGHPMQPLLPMLRLRIFYDTPDDICDTQKLAQYFAKEVANPRTIVMWKKGVIDKKRRKAFLEFDEDDDVWNTGLDMQSDLHESVKQRLEHYFTSEQNKDKLKVLTLKGLNLALTNVVEKNNLYSFSTIIEIIKENTAKYIAQFDPKTDKEIEQRILEYRDLCRESDESTQEMQERLDAFQRRGDEEVEMDDLSDDDISERSIPKAPRGRGRARGRSSAGRGSRGGRGRGRGAKTSDETLNDDAEEVSVPAKTTRGRARGTGSRGRAKTATTRGRATASSSLQMDDDDGGGDLFNENDVKRWTNLPELRYRR